MIINSIVDTVSNQLYEEFNIDVLFEDVFQGQRYPFIKINLVNINSKELINDGRLYQIRFDIAYSVKDGRDIAELTDFFVRVRECIGVLRLCDYTEYDNMLPAYNIRCEIVENVAHFMAVYDVHLHREKEIGDVYEKFINKIEVI